MNLLNLHDIELLISKIFTYKHCIFKGEKIDATDLKNILRDMGIEVNDKECLDLRKSLPIDGELHLQPAESSVLWSSL